jgi:hypothetical protein
MVGSTDQDTLNDCGYPGHLSDVGPGTRNISLVNSDRVAAALDPTLPEFFRLVENA